MGQGQGQAPGSGPAGAQWEPFLSEGTAGEASPFGVSMVEELLPDSFLKRMFGAFFAMLQVGVGSSSGAAALRTAPGCAMQWERCR